MAERERRFMSGTVERAETSDQPTLQGYAAVFNQRTEIMGLFEERIAPGAFSDAIGRDDVRALFNHDPNNVLGRVSAGTLSLRQDDHGLGYSIVPPDTQVGRDVTTLVTRGDVQGSSFSFEIEDGGETWDRSGRIPLRTITKAKLYDVGPVTFPQYEQARVSARAVTEATIAAAETLSREISRWKLASIA